MKDIYSRLILVAAAALLTLPSINAFAQNNATWNGGSGSWTNSNNWSTSSVPSAQDNVFIDGGNGVNSSVSLNGHFAIGSLKIDAGDQLYINNAEGLHIVQDDARPMSGIIDNAGNIFVTSTQSLTNFQVTGDVTMLGGGTLTLSGTDARVFNFFGDNELTNVDNRIEGWGRLGNGALKFINATDGVIDANDSNESMLINAATGITHENHGLMKASSGGDLLLFDGLFDNTDGVILAETGSTVTLNHASDISGGSIQTTGTGLIQVGASQTTFLRNMTLDADIYVNNAGAIRPFGLIENLGTITIDSYNDSQTDLLLNNADATFEGGGTIHLTGAGTNARIWAAGGSVVFTNVDNTIEGKGRIGANNTMRLFNEADGLVDANDNSGILILDPPATNEFRFENRGLIKASNGGGLELRTGVFDNTDGVIRAENGTTVTLAGVELSNGLLQSEGTGEIVVATSSRIIDLTLEGTVNQNNAAAFFWNGTINNQAEVNVNSTGAFTDVSIGSPVVVTGDGSINLTAANSRVIGFGSLEMTSGTLSGIGHVFIGSVFHQNATVAPGNSVGTLRFGLPVEFGTGATLDIEVKGTSSFDVVEITDTLTLGCDLQISLNGFTPSDTDTFTIVTTEGITGSFANVASGGRLIVADGTGSFEVNYGTNVVLSDFQPAVPLPVTDLNVIRGVQAGGTVSSVASSDNLDLSVRRDPTLIAAVVEVEVESTTTVFNPSVFAFTVESSTFNRTRVVESVEFFDYDSGGFVEISSKDSSRFLDSVAVSIGTGDLARFVEDGTGKVKARLLYLSDSPRQTFTANIDHVFWSID